MKKKVKPLHWIDCQGEPFMRMDGFDDCCIGVMERIGQDKILIYDKTAIIQKMMREEGISEIDAIEWYEYNMIGAYIGERTPGFITLRENL